MKNLQAVPPSLYSMRRGSVNWQGASRCYWVCMYFLFDGEMLRLNSGLIELLEFVAFMEASSWRWANSRFRRNISESLRKLFMQPMVVEPDGSFRGIENVKVTCQHADLNSIALK